MSHYSNYYRGLGYGFGGSSELGHGYGCGCGSFHRMGSSFGSGCSSFHRLGSGGFGYRCHRPSFYGGYGFSSFY
ncbi:keratin-associated protein 19-3-like [Equus asinus]|uniref:Uncharacterized protein n=1 Tax=Equus asinus TaxID=9793 RepID=A0A9L0K8N2_EQUAS|nr:keratin-associated protein 19-3-like [Equus asinus]